MTDKSKLPEPPYYAVIFTSLRTDKDPEVYEKVSDEMFKMARGQPGYLGFETARGEDGIGITVSYWKDEPSLRAWKERTEHKAVQEKGRKDWYKWYHVRVARVEREYSFFKKS